MIGDVVGKPGRKAVAACVPLLRAERAIDIVIANGENAAGGSGVTPETSRELFGAGVDIITSGDHVWKRREVIQLIAIEKRLLRPANYPPGTPGEGNVVIKTRNAVPVGVINLVGRVFMPPVDSPFAAAEQVVSEIRKTAKVIIVDIHAEATSEKKALFWFLNGKVSAVIGTHTHVQTADEFVSGEGTAYLTDAGMTGAFHSVIGRAIEPVLSAFVTGLPQKFEVATEDIRLSAVLVEIDPDSGHAVSVERLEKKI